MLLSMTGFGKATVQIPAKKITVEIKSLNSKQFDIQSRIPGSYRELELDLRNMAAARLERGKVDMVISVEALHGNVPVQLNIPALKAYKEQIQLMSKDLDIPLPDDWYATLLRLPDVYSTEISAEMSEEEILAVRQVVSEAIEGVMEFRRKEGRRLEDFFASRIKAITDMLTEVPKFEMERVAKIKSRMEDALGNIAQVDYDRGRLEQEMIYYIEKLDVNEEKQRLAQHLQYFTETLSNPAPGQGKKLGFIAQEIGREINTLGSKSNHAELQKLVVKMKDELEQIKEQVLNVM
ncbi:MAG: YicC family protein [Muribaculaceae bacterium]|nr:YicC family protein [Muribaculaceae bacterium]